MAEAKVKKGAPKVEGEGDVVVADRSVTVFATYGKFEDLHTGKVIREEAETITWTPWIQANIDKGLLTEAV